MNELAAEIESIKAQFLAETGYDLTYMICGPEVTTDRQVAGLTVLTADEWAKQVGWPPVGAE